MLLELHRRAVSCCHDQSKITLALLGSILAPPRVNGRRQLIYINVGQAQELSDGVKWSSKSTLFDRLDWLGRALGSIALQSRPTRAQLNDSHLFQCASGS